MAGSDRAYFVADGGQNQLMGAAGIALRKDFAEVMTVQVDPTIQGQGLGRQLMDQLMATVADADLNHVLLEVADGNSAAIGLYKSMGFTTIGLRKAYYQPSGQDALVMQLVMAEP